MSEFKWSDELVREYQTFYVNNPHISIDVIMQKFKASKQKKKEWEILSFQYVADNFFLNKNEDGSFGQYFADEEILCQSPVHKIHSVRRLSDGEVFTVGDRVSWGLEGNFEDKIKGFMVDDGEMRFDVTVLGDVPFLKAYNLRKVKQPLFATEDGETVYGEETVWWLKGGKEDWHWAIYMCKAKDVERPREDIKYFSTKEAAAEYVLMNKPCLSINDIKAGAGFLTSFRVEIAMSDLIQLAKNKILE